MVASTSYGYNERIIFDIRIFVEALRFAAINLILAFIFLFLTFEEIDWAILSSRKDTNDIIIDNSSWNIRSIISLLKF